jgi:hypothetical protein
VVQIHHKTSQPLQNPIFVLSTCSALHDANRMDITSFFSLYIMHDIPASCISRKREIDVNDTFILELTMMLLLKLEMWGWHFGSMNSW